MLRNFYFSIVAFLFLGASAFAQNTNGAIKVLLKDKTTGETIPFANIVAYQNGVQVGVATTDMDGYAMIKPLAPGKYDIQVFQFNNRRYIFCIGIHVCQRSATVASSAENEWEMKNIEILFVGLVRGTPL